MSRPRLVRLLAAAAGGLFLYVAWLGWSPLLQIPAAPAGPAPARSNTAPGEAGRPATAESTAPQTAATGPAQPEAVSRAPIPLPPATPAEPSERPPSTLGPSPGNLEIRDPAAPPTPATGQEDTGGSRSPPADATDPEDVAAEDPADAPRPDLALDGWVRDERGAGVGGLRVTARPRRLFAGSGDGQSPEALTGRSVLTEATGRFSMPALLPGEYELRTEDTDRYEGARSLVRAGVDSVVLVVESKSPRLLRVRGVVESAHGGPLAGVRVELVGQAGLAALSDTSGGYHLVVPLNRRTRNAALRFHREGYREELVPASDVAAPDADELVRNARLEPSGATATVTGVVAGADGAAVDSARIQLYSASLRRRYQAVSDASGGFSLPGVEEADDYRLWVRPQRGYRDHVRDAVAIRAPATRLDAVVDSLRTATLRGSMVDPYGRPLPGFALWVRPAFGVPGPPAVAVAGDAEGRFRVPDLPEGPVALATRAAPRLTVTGIRLAAGQERELRLPLDVGEHRLEGQVVGEAGAPVPGARISLLWSRNQGGIESRSFRETVGDPSGEFVFTQLGPGAHTLSVVAPGFRGVRLEHQVGSGAPVRILLVPADP